MKNYTVTGERNIDIIRRICKSVSKFTQYTRARRMRKVNYCQLECEKRINSQALLYFHEEKWKNADTQHRRSTAGNVPKCNQLSRK